MKSLDELFLSGTAITGEGLKGLPLSVKQLCLDQCSKLEDTYISGLVKRKHLKALSLLRCNLEYETIQAFDNTGIHVAWQEPQASHMVMKAFGGKVLQEKFLLGILSGKKERFS